MVNYISSIFFAGMISCLFAVYAGGNLFYNQWVSLGEPPETAIRIVGIEVGSAPGGMIYQGRETKVYVETITGRIFKCCENSKNGFWEETPNIISNEDLFLEYCGPLETGQRVHRSDEKDQRGVNWCGEYDSGIVSYSLTEDGNIWSRKTYESPMLTFWWMILSVIVSFLLLVAILVLNGLFQVINTWKRE